MVKESSTKDKKDVYIEAIGRRKESVARVRICKATDNEVLINGKTLEGYFPLIKSQEKILSPLKKLEDKDKRKITAVVKGGGVSGQAEAVKLGLARALVKEDPERKAILKKDKLLSCDSRVKERRKFGLKKARKAAQWSKR